MGAYAGGGFRRENPNGPFWRERQRGEFGIPGEAGSSAAEGLRPSSARTVGQRNDLPTGRKRASTYAFDEAKLLPVLM